MTSNYTSGVSRKDNVYYANFRASLHYPIDDKVIESLVSGIQLQDARFNHLPYALLWADKMGMNQQTLVTSVHRLMKQMGVAENDFTLEPISDVALRVIIPSYAHYANAFRERQLDALCRPQLSYSR